MTIQKKNYAIDRRDLRRGAAQILSGFGVRIFARILLLLFVARAYGVESFGRLGEVIAIVEIAAALATFGLNKTLLGELEKQNSSEARAQSIAEAMLLVVLLSLLAMAILWSAWPLVFSGSMSSARFVLIAIPMIAVAEIATTATRHLRTIVWDTLVKAVIKPWSFLLLAVLAHVWSSPSALHLSSEQALLMAYSGSLFLSALVAFLGLTHAYDAAIFMPQRASLAGSLALAKRSWKIGLNETGVFAFRRVDIILLALVAGPGTTGVYYAAQQIGTIVEKIRYLFEPMLAPIIAQSKSLSAIGYHLRRLCLIIFTVQLAIVAVVATFGEPILAWLGSGFALGLPVVLAVLAGEVADGSFGLCELPMAYRHPAWPVRTVLLALAVEAVLIWLLAEQFGALGAALGFAASMVLLAGMRIFLVYRLYGARVVGFGHGVVLVIAIAIIWALNGIFLPRAEMGLLQGLVS